MSVFKIKEGYEPIHELFGSNEKKKLDAEYNELRRKEQEVLSQIKSAESRNDNGAKDRLSAERDRLLKKMEEISEKKKNLK